MKKVLLIGSDGYIGSKFFELYKDIYNIISIDREKKRHETIQQDYEDLKKDFIYEFDTVILLAGDSSVKSCEGSFLKSYKNNIEKFVYLLEKLKLGQKFIYASSSSVYGITDHPVTEDFITRNFIQNYDATKILIDDIIKMFDYEFYSLRFGTVNGPAPYTRKDIMINSMVYNAWNKNSIEIYNKQIHRPILDIVDLCSAIMKIINNNDSSKRGFYNLCSYNSSVGEIAEKASYFLKVPLIDKGRSADKHYDFQINNEKFCNNFDFKFTATTDSIINTFIKEKYKIIWK
jgi:dTDP-4-dehydrorhamnose reductase